ncbi:MAG: hypothetical protein IKD74_05365 [Clostridia bacterium]|nr:hypothetical protein [Clostridia bacterium]
MNKIKIAAVLVIICIFSSLITSIVKAQDKITLSVNIAEIESNKNVIDLTDMKAELVIEEIIIDTNTAKNEENLALQNTDSAILTSQEEVIENEEQEIVDTQNMKCEVVVIPSITGTIEIEEIIETSQEANVSTI